MNLGQAIQALKVFGTTAGEEPKDVRFDFGRFTVNGLRSYRGYYDHLAFGFREATMDKPAMTAEELLKLMVEETLGKTFQGYKGGDYVMDENTKLWVANWGDCHSTAVDRMTDEGIAIIIHTRFEG